MQYLRSSLFAFSVFIFSVWATAAWARQATPPPPPPPDCYQRLEELERREKTLERNLELKDEQLTEKEKEKPIGKITSEGVSIGSADGNNEIRFRGLVQTDARFYLDRDEVGATNTLVLRRVRPYIEGKFAKRFAYKIMPDFGQGQVVLFDAYIDSEVFPEFKIETGKYKPPVGLERLESAQNLHFIERGLPTQLVPNRALGLMFHGEVAGGVFAYELGGFTGVPDGANIDIGVDNSWEFAGRIFAQPFKKTSAKAAQGLGFGISGTWGHLNSDLKNPNLTSGYKTSGQNTFFSYLNDGTPAGTVLASGTQFRVSPQLYYYYKGFGLLGEYALSSQNVTLGAARQQLQNTSWQVAASYVIGADNAYGAIKPRKPLGWKKGGTGAFEFGVRFNELGIDKAAFTTFADPNKSARNAKAFAVAFNWIINNNVKFMLDYEQTRFDGGAKGGDRPIEHLLINRYQIAF
jgi:phosphate-selective porin OprO and OprP